ncbi:MAG TPA: hypothetical protein VF516_28615, partial [Kofleriaceae bacterium]
LIAALDGALRAIDDLAAAVAIPEPLPVPVEVDPEADDEPAPRERWEPAEPATPAAGPEPIVLSFPAEPRRYPSLQDTLRASRKRKRKRDDRAEEASVLRWGGVVVATR